MEDVLLSIEAAREVHRQASDASGNVEAASVAHRPLRRHLGRADRRWRDGSDYFTDLSVTSKTSVVFGGTTPSPLAPYPKEEPMTNFRVPPGFIPPPAVIP